MSRQRRRDHAGAVQHVMARTLPEIPLLFRDDDDRRSFALRLARVAQEEKYRLLAVALMPNHVHIVGQTGASPLWRVMKRLESGYAATYNKKYGRRGYLFENRYRSKLVSTRDYLETVILYVLLNPLRGGVVPSLKELEDHPWTSLPQLLGRSAPLFTEVPATLSIFGESAARARRVVVSRLREIIAAGPIEPLTFEVGSSSERLTAGPITNQVVGFANDQFEHFAERMRRSARIRARWTLGKLVRFVCNETGASATQFYERDRTAVVADARAIVAHLLVSELDVRAVDVTALLGLGESAVSKAIRRGKVLAAELSVTLDDAEKTSKVA